LRKGRGHKTTELCGVTLPFYTLKVKEGWQKMGRTDNDNGEVDVGGQPVVF